MVKGPGRNLTLAALVAAGVISAYGFLFDRVLVQPPQRNAEVLVDAHTHPPLSASIDELANTLSHGAVGLTERNRGGNILTYDLALRLLPNVQEIDNGLFATFTYNGKRGYFFKVQEIDSDFHVLAIGVRKRLPDFIRAEDAVDAVHANGGVAILNHPYIALVSNKSRPTILQDDFGDYTEKRRINLAAKADEVEEFNGSAVNALPGFYDLSEANRRSSSLRSRLQAKGVHHKGIAVSDAHYVTAPILKVGISVQEEGLNMERLKQFIRDGNFTIHTQYARRWDVLRGAILNKYYGMLLRNH